MENPGEMKQISVVHGVDKETFNTEIYPKRWPVVLRGLDLGPCQTNWTVQYLCEAGGSQDVKVHVSPSAKMDFINKNYAYRTLPFDELVRRASKPRQEEYFFEPDELYYLRALGNDPRKDIADINTQFPSLAGDINIPDFVPQDKLFSSVLRLGSPGVQLWTHYDVMDNILLQVKGHKRAVLFSPQDATYLYLNGDKSTILDIDNPDLEKYPEFMKATPYECHLEPGDVLFIPALWFHNVQALEFSIAVNIFWKHLEAKQYDPKDTYGNKDPQAAARALQIMRRAVKCLEELPEEYRDFYGRRMVMEIENKTYMKDGKDGNT
ncbi:tRNA wybutosine-synthesizing protein 5-like [Amphiura filiformis]|uniref:tRNA wybutosine-synthesizing protein 5-like n=1 Tax=Amphiura filiformis TaxID=82378 RepID=UPI003B226F81